MFGEQKLYRSNAIGDIFEDRTQSNYYTHFFALTSCSDYRMVTEDVQHFLELFGGSVLALPKTSANQLKFRSLARQNIALLNCIFHYVSNDDNLSCLT